MAIADVFSKNDYTIPNKNAKILKYFENFNIFIWNGIAIF